MDNFFGKNLRSHRKELGLSQTKFAKPLNLDVSSISAIELGKYIPSDAVIDLIEIKYGLNRNWLLTGEGDKYIKVGEGGKGPECDTCIYKVGMDGDDPETVDLLTMCREILKSNTGYTHSLAANIRSFHQAMQNEQCLTIIKNTMGQLVSDVEDIKQQIRQRNHIRENDDQARRGEILKKRKA